MSTGNPYPYIFQYLHNTLIGDSTLFTAVSGEITRNRANRAGDGTTLVLPAVVVTIPREGQLLQEISNDIVWNDFDILVKCVNRDNDIANTKTIVDRINTLLHGSSGSVTGFTIRQVTKTNDVYFLEDYAGSVIDHMGSVFNIIGQFS